jgi:hypothetical protein
VARIFKKGVFELNSPKQHLSASTVSARKKSAGAVRVIIWVVLTVLIVLVLLALFLPDRGLATRGAGGSEPQDRHQLVVTGLPTASSTPSEKRMLTRSPSIA